MRASFSLAILILAVFILIITSCQSNEPFEPIQNSQQPSGGEWEFAKRPIRSEKESVSNGYPQIASLEIVWFGQQNGYSTGNLNFVNGTKLYVPFNSLTPPSGTPPCESVMINGLIEKDEVNNELIYSFGPSGCQFDQQPAVYCLLTCYSSSRKYLFGITTIPLGVTVKRFRSSLGL